MTIPILPQSQCNGEIFVSTFRAVHDLLQVPSVRLDPFHPFRQLWHSHLHTLTQTGGLFEGVIDCLAAILLGDPCWKETTPMAVSQTRSDVCSLLIRTPPNIIVVSSLDDYACHIRCPALWNFVCISKSYVTLWMEANKPKRKNGLTALLITSIDHEIAHWAQSIKNGLCYLPPSSHVSNLGLTTTSDLGSDSSDDDDDSSTASPVNKAKVSPEVDLSIVPLVGEAEVSPFNMTHHSSGGTEVVSSIVNDTDMSIHNETLLLADLPKAFQAPWMSGPIGEAGDFLEISTRGGIMEYDPVRQRVYFAVGKDDFHFPGKSYLDLYEQNEGSSTSLFFCPTSRKSSTLSDIRTKIANARFPFKGVDGCSPTRRSYQRNRHHVPTKVLKL